MKTILVTSRLLLAVTAAASMSVIIGCSTTGTAPAAANAAETDKPAELAVKITPTISSVSVMHNGKPVTVMRNQDGNNKVNPEFAKTSRKCPPFCIQPFTIAPGVETIGEVEMVDYLGKMGSGDKSIIVVDSRTPDWVERGTIPGAVNIPFTKLDPDKGADPVSIAESLESFGAVETGKGWDFSNVKTIVLFCNGQWCGQSPISIRTMLKQGFPAAKIKWYRGGMQSWSNLGFNTVTPEATAR
ncbi:MAG TPA: rhodanese-like domain-containing protein [Gammaproteobacteria bacterium]